MPKIKKLNEIGEYKELHGDDTPRNLVDSAVKAMRKVGHELQQWAGGMALTNLKGSKRHLNLIEVSDTLLGMERTIKQFPNPKVRITHSYQVPRRKNRQPSRIVRLENANVKIQAVIQFYEDLDSEHARLIKDLNKHLSKVTIPIMYG